MGAFSLYLHIPYCDSKCPYCDFNSYAAKEWPEREYCTALIAEMESYAAHAPWRDGNVQTVFFGGGTPSLFRPESIAQILEAAFRLWPTPAPGNRFYDSPRLDQQPGTIDRQIEITLEANPGTVNLEKLRGFTAAGVNRVSFGVQSFQPRHLTRLGRIHSAAEAVHAAEHAREAGIRHLNLDLMFAVPDQTLTEWEADLRTAVALAPAHISAYNLTFEEGTPFYALRRNGVLRPLTEEIEIAMFTRTQEILGAAGYQQYEVSNYALPRNECQHNLNYWQGGECLGVGAGAHSFSHLPFPGRRWSNEKQPSKYIRRVLSDGHARATAETLSEQQARGEFVFLGLRCRSGFDGDSFRSRFDVEFLSAFPHGLSLERDGLLAREGARFYLTQRGLLLADSVFAMFV